MLTSIWPNFSSSHKHNLLCQTLVSKHVSKLRRMKLRSKKCGNTGLPNLQCRLCIHVRAHACGAVCGRLLGQVTVEVSLGSVGNLFQWSLQLTRRPNEPGQGLLLWACPAKPSQVGLLQQSHRHYRLLNAPLNTPLHPQLNSPLEP